MTLPMRKDELGSTDVIGWADRGSTAVELPVPEREDDDVRSPDVQRIQQQRA